MTKVARHSVSKPHTAGLAANRKAHSRSTWGADSSGQSGAVWHGKGNA